MPLKQKKEKIREIPFQPSTLETIDYAMYNYLNEELNLFSSTHDGWDKVPIIWSSAERSYQLKHDKDLRDEDGALILPLITIERTSVIKDPASKGTVWANVPPVDDIKGGSITIARRIQQEKTSNFANADAARAVGGVARYGDGRNKGNQSNFPIGNKKIVYETISIPIPVYLDINYSITIQTEYQQQMNELITPFATKTGGINYFIIKHDGHRFEAFFQPDFTFGNNTSAMDADRRKYETSIGIRVLGYIVGQDKNQEQPKIVIRENAVEYKFSRERTIFGEIPEDIDRRNQSFYRE